MSTLSSSAHKCIVPQKYFRTVAYCNHSHSNQTGVNRRYSEGIGHHTTSCRQIDRCLKYITRRFILVHVHRIVCYYFDLCAARDRRSLERCLEPVSRRCGVIFFPTMRRVGYSIPNIAHGLLFMESYALISNIVSREANGCIFIFLRQSTLVGCLEC